MKPRLSLCLIALATVALIVSGSTDAGMIAPSARVSPSATTEQIDRYQLEVLAAINCEELALQPGLSDELSRSWMLCSLYSLYDAISLLPEVGLTGHYLVEDRMFLGWAKEEDLDALSKHPLDKAKIRRAIVYKKGVVKIIHKHAPQPPEPAGCGWQAGVAPQLPGFYEFKITCPGAISSGTLWLPENTITGKAGYVTPKGEHKCPHKRHRIDCKGIPRGTKIVNFFAETTPLPRPGQTGLVEVILRGNRVGVFHRRARALSAPLQPAPSQPHVQCNGSVSVLSATPPPVYGYDFSCTKVTTDFSITLAPDRSVLNASTPSGYSCAPTSANGGTNNVLQCNRTSGVTAAGRSVSGQVQTNQGLASGSVKLTVFPQNMSFSLTGP